MNREQRRQFKQAAQATLDADGRSRGEQYAAAPAPDLLPVPVPDLTHDAALNAWLRPMLSLWVPAGWRLYGVGSDGWCFIGAPPASLKLICSGESHPDGRRWLHCSLTGPDRVPTWAEQVATKEAFCGAESCAVMVIPPRSEYVNHDPRCLHWWVCADGRPLPDFTLGRGMI